MNSISSDYKLSDYQLEQFSKYYQFLVEENEKINLTSITDIEEVYIKHFWDSLAMQETSQKIENKTLCDIGSGAGFPSIPLKIANPSLKVTIIEPTLKRVRFLQNLCDILKISDIKIINARAEDVVNDYRENFDIVTARAVSGLSIILELSIPFIKVEGSFIAYKGNSYTEEISTAKKCMDTLEVSLENIFRYELPKQYGSRSLLFFTKRKPTSKKYPRRYAEIKKKPL